MRLSAMSLDDEGCFDCFIHTDIQPDAYESEQMGLSMNELDSAHPSKLCWPFSEFWTTLAVAAHHSSFPGSDLSMVLQHLS